MSTEYYGPTRNDSRSWLGWILFLFVVAIAIAILAFAFGWIGAPLDVMSADNVRRLSQEANDSWEALQAQLQNIEAAEQSAQDILDLYGEDQSTWPQGKDEEYLQARQQVRNSSTAYNNSCGQYNAMWQDEWRSIPAPDDLPTSCELYSE